MNTKEVINQFKAKDKKDFSTKDWENQFNVGVWNKYVKWLWKNI